MSLGVARPYQGEASHETWLKSPLGLRSTNAVNKGYLLQEVSGEYSSPHLETDDKFLGLSRNGPLALSYTIRIPGDLPPVCGLRVTPLSGFVTVSKTFVRKRAGVNQITSW